MTQSSGKDCFKLLALLRLSDTDGQVLLAQSAADKIEGVLGKLLSPGHEIIPTATKEMYSGNLLPLHVHCRELEIASAENNICINTV